MDRPSQSTYEGRKDHILKPAQEAQIGDLAFELSVYPLTL